MDPHIQSALIGLVAALLAWTGGHYHIALDDQGAQQAAIVIVTYIIGWLRPKPGTAPAPAAD